MMFQDPIGSLSPRQTIRSLITEPFEIHGLDGKNLRDEVEPPVRHGQPAA